jgi:hypothetical protein
MQSGLPHSRCHIIHRSRFIDDHQRVVYEVVAWRLPNAEIRWIDVFPRIKIFIVSDLMLQLVFRQHEVVVGHFQNPVPYVVPADALVPGERQGHVEISVTE